MASRFRSIAQPGMGPSRPHPAMAAKRPSQARRDSRAANCPARPSAGKARHSRADSQGVRPLENRADHAQQNRRLEFALGADQSDPWRRGRAHPGIQGIGFPGAILVDHHQAVGVRGFVGFAHLARSFQAGDLGVGPAGAQQVELAGPDLEAAEELAPSRTSTTSCLPKCRPTRRRTNSRDSTEASRATAITETAGTSGDFSRIGVSSRATRRPIRRKTKQPFRSAIKHAAAGQAQQQHDRLDEAGDDRGGRSHHAPTWRARSRAARASAAVMELELPASSSSVVQPPGGRDASAAAAARAS